MNEKLIMTVFEKIIAMILQESAYLFVEKLDPCERPEFSEWIPIGAAIEYTGQATGIIRLWAEESLARIIALNMLGMDFDSNLEKGKSTDALKEILNMITGNFITAYYGDNSPVKLGLPSLPDVSFLKRDFENEGTLWFNVEDHFMLVAIEIHI